MIKTHITYTHTKFVAIKKKEGKKYFNCFYNYILQHNFLVFSFFENILSRQSKQTKKILKLCCEKSQVENKKGISKNLKKTIWIRPRTSSMLFTPWQF